MQYITRELKTGQRAGLRPLWLAYGQRAARLARWWHGTGTGTAGQRDGQGEYI